MAIRIGQIAPFWSSSDEAGEFGPNYKSTFFGMLAIGAGIATLIIDQGPGFSSLDTKSLRFIASVITLASVPAVAFSTGFFVTQKCRTQTTPFYGVGDDLAEDRPLLGEEGQSAPDGGDGADSVDSFDSGEGEAGEKLGPVEDEKSPTSNVSKRGRCMSNCPPGPKLAGLLLAVLATGVTAAVVGSTVGFKQMWMTLVKSDHLAAGSVIAASGVASGLVSFAGHWAAEYSNGDSAAQKGCLSKVLEKPPCFGSDTSGYEAFN